MRRDGSLRILLSCRNALRWGDARATCWMLISPAARPWNDGATYSNVSGNRALESLIDFGRRPLARPDQTSVVSHGSLNGEYGIFGRISGINPP